MDQRRNKREKGQRKMHWKKESGKHNSINGKL